MPQKKTKRRYILPNSCRETCAVVRIDHTCYLLLLVCSCWPCDMILSHAIRSLADELHCKLNQSNTRMWSMFSKTLLAIHVFFVHIWKETHSNRSPRGKNKSKTYRNHGYFTNECGNTCLVLFKKLIWCCKIFEFRIRTSHIWLKRSIKYVTISNNMWHPKK